MSEYLATVTWQRGEQPFTDNRYSRGHSWQFDGGLTIPASASPQVVPLPMSVEFAVDPEEAFVASLSSCHMLFFLSLAHAAGLVVDSYTDRAVGAMERDGEGRTSITRVTLNPEVIFAGENPPREVLEELHHQAHEQCFIANSVRTEVVTKIVA